MYNAVIGEGDVLTCVCPSVCQQWAGGRAVSLSLVFTQENVILYIICLHSRYRVYNAVMGEGNVLTCVCPSVKRVRAGGRYTSLLLSDLAVMGEGDMCIPLVSL